MISVVCPFYNEAAIIEAAIQRMLANLTTLGRPWELIVVNDGSTDNSFALAHALMAGQPAPSRPRLPQEPRSRICLAYRHHRGARATSSSPPRSTAPGATILLTGS